jgi:hypothetical protein
MAGAWPVKVTHAETVAASSLQKHKQLCAELVEGRRKGRDDPRVELSSRGVWRHNHSCSVFFALTFSELAFNGSTSAASCF